MTLTGSLSTALPLTGMQLAQIRAQFERLLHAPVDFVVSVDPSLVGGFVAMVDGRIYDASVRTQLEALREELTAQEERT